MKLRNGRPPTVCEYVGARARFGAVVVLARDWTYCGASGELILDGCAAITVGAVHVGARGVVWLDRGMKLGVSLAVAIGEVAVLTVDGRPSVGEVFGHSLDRHPLISQVDFGRLSSDVQGCRISWPIGVEVLRG